MMYFNCKSLIIISVSNDIILRWRLCRNCSGKSLLFAVAIERTFFITSAQVLPGLAGEGLVLFVMDLAVELKSLFNCLGLGIEAGVILGQNSFWMLLSYGEEHNSCNRVLSYHVDELTVCFFLRICVDWFDDLDARLNDKEHRRLKKFKSERNLDNRTD